MDMETSAVSKDKETFIANAEALKNLGGKNIDEMSDDEVEAFLAERKKLKGANEGLKDKAFDEATTENQERDAEKAKMEAAAAETARQEQAKKDGEAHQADQVKADELAGKIKNGEVGVKAVESTEVAQENPLDAMEKARTDEDINRGAAEFALSQNDIPGFQKAYIKMSESLIAVQEATIANLDKSFASGNFQNRGPSSDEKVKEIYDYQKNQALKIIQSIKEHSIGQVQKDPESIIQRDEFERSPNAAGLLSKLAGEVESLLKEEDRMGYGRGKTYPHATARLEGYISAALQSKNTEVMRSLPSLAQRIPLSPELQKQIADLKG